VKSILDILFSNYFEITEEKVKLYESKKEQETDTATKEQDLLSLIGHVILENDRLQDIQQELEKKSGSNEEMENFIKKLITFLDGFERTLNLARQYPPSEEIDNWLQSVETTYFRLFHLLKKFGLKPLDTIGKPVNLNYHDVVEYRPTLNYMPDTVISERQKGYFFASS